ncbi:hypothetical protein FQA39_LY10830 [Lamprigera yunnana]|nr:hypothetical protein FQA39_LY10830 [Lamprigera yunnana]
MSQLSSSQPIHQSVPQMYLSQTVSQPMSSNSNYYIHPNQEQFLNNQKITHTPQEVQNSPQYIGMSFTSDDEMDLFTPQDYTWQVLKAVKRRKNSTNKEAATVNLTLDNRYSTLAPPLENETSNKQNNKIEVNLKQNSPEESSL